MVAGTFSNVGSRCCEFRDSSPLLLTPETANTAKIEASTQRNNDSHLITNPCACTGDRRQLFGWEMMHGFHVSAHLDER